MTDLSDIVQGDYSQVDESTLYFETIPIYKIIILSILTLGIYQLVWFYKNWQILKVKFGYKISPFWRTIFAPFTNFKLFPIMKKYIKKFNVKSFNALSLAGWYFWGCILDIIFILGAYCNGKSLGAFSFTPNYGEQFLDTLIACALPISIYFSISALFCFTLPTIIKIQSSINKVNKQNFTNASKSTLCGIKTIVLLLIGNLIIFTLHVFVLGILIYCLGPINPEAQYRLGNIYKENYNYPKAYKWYKKSCEQNYPKAMYELAILYEDGKGVSQDLSKAIDLYKRIKIGQSSIALRSNNTQSSNKGKSMSALLKSQKKSSENIKKIQSNLGTTTSIKFLEDEQEYIKKIYESDSQFTSRNERYNEDCKLGVMYENYKNFPQAHEYYNKAINQGSIFAHYRLGNMYETGNGVHRDPQKACKHYRIVAQSYVY